MKKLFSAAVSRLESGQPAVLVSVVASSGSTPRGAGAMMAVFADGVSAGTVGGGAVEYAAQRQARELIASKSSKLNSYLLTKTDVADLGMICGGDVTIFYEYFDPADSRSLELFRYLRQALDRNENAWIVRRFQSGTAAETAVFDGGGLHFASLCREEDIKPLLQNTAQLTEGEVRYYTEPLVRAGRVYVFGGGHVSQELVPLLARVGFSVTVFEDREDFAREALFPDAADTVLHDFARISERVTVSETDYVVVMTRGHQYDYEVLRQMFKTGAKYIGCIGSAKKIETTKRRLMDDGVAEAEFKRLYSPIGLKIKAETPAEIAVSVTAEMILFRAENL